MPFPATGTPRLIAVNAAVPVWSHAGRKLFYISNPFRGGGRLTSVTVTATPALTVSNPTPFELKRLPGDILIYDVLPDGGVVYRASATDRPAPPPASPPIHVVLNWFTELRQRVPVK